VHALLARGFSPELPAFSALGYREIARHVQGEFDLAECRNEIRRATRRLVRHQANWFREADRSIVWIDAGPQASELAAEHIEDGVVGVIYGRAVTNKGYTPNRTGMVDQAFVEPQHRRRGVGARLVAELCRFFAGQGIEDLSLRYVTGNEEAAGFWTALGFTPRIVTAGASRQVVELLAQAHPWESS